MSFKDKVKTDVTEIFLNTNELAETIQYTPYGQSAKSIKALVDRGNVAGDPQFQNKIGRNQCKIAISIDATEGVASVDKGRDAASFPDILGGSAVDWAVVDILGRDDGMWLLKLQR